MIWLNERKRIWRTAVLLLLLIAFTGPWFFDRIWVPAEYICSAPNIRLDNTFCGKPQSLMSFSSFIIGDFQNMAANLFAGEMDPMSLIFISFLLLLVLPLLSTSILIWRGDQQRWHRFQMIVLGLAAGISLFLGLIDFSRPYWALWGVWLYIVLVVSMLILERLTFVAGRKLVHE
jgi:hypothetical protein